MVTLWTSCRSRAPERSWGAPTQTDENRKRRHPRASGGPISVQNTMDSRFRGYDAVFGHDLLSLVFVFIDIPGSFVHFSSRRGANPPPGVRLGFRAGFSFAPFDLSAPPHHDLLSLFFVCIDIPGSFVDFLSRRGAGGVRSSCGASNRIRLCAFRFFSSQRHDLLSLFFVCIDIPGSFVDFLSRRSANPLPGVRGFAGSIDPTRRLHVRDENFPSGQCLWYASQLRKAT